MTAKRREAAHGVMWSAIERFSVQGVQFLLNIIIASILLPSDYGLVAMLSIFMAVAQTFVDSGFANALIQKSDRDEVDYSTVFYFNIAVAILLYMILYVSAPAISAFYSEEPLTLMTRWLGLNLIINALSIVQRAKLTIQTDFKTQAKASLAAACLSGLTGLAMAYSGFGVWSLVVMNILNNSVNTMLLWIYAKWYPIWCFSWSSFRTLFSFGSKLLVSGLLHTIYLNLYSLVIGRFYQANDTGYYNRASSLAQFPSINIATIITRVVFPLQCKIQDEQAKLETSFLFYLRLSCLVIFPLMTLIGVLAEPLVLSILGEKWLPAAKLLTILSFAYILSPILVLNNTILNVKGRSDYFLKAEIIKKIVSVSILLGTLSFGVEVLCWGLLAYNIVDYIIIVFFARKVVNVGYLIQIKNIAPILILSATMSGVVYFTISLISHPIAQLLVGGFVGVIFFVLVGRIFSMREIIFAESWLKSRLNRR